MTTQQTTSLQTELAEQGARPAHPGRRRRRWWSPLDPDTPVRPPAGEPQAWARRAHAQQRPTRRWSEADDGRPVVPDAPRLASRPLFARYPLLRSGRS